jgi:hypothetical protein
MRSLRDLLPWRAWIAEIRLHSECLLKPGMYGEFESVIEGQDGLRDRQLCKRSARHAGADEIARMLSLYREFYPNVTVRRFREQLVKRHNQKLD